MGGRTDDMGGRMVRADDMGQDGKGGALSHGQQLSPDIKPATIKVGWWQVNQHALMVSTEQTKAVHEHAHEAWNQVQLP